VGGGRYETCLAGISEAGLPPTLALPHKGGGDHKSLLHQCFSANSTVLPLTPPSQEGGKKRGTLAGFAQRIRKQ
jgi:hypothetical protein